MAADTDIRQWAREKGLQVGERGRLPGDVTEAYRAEHPDYEGRVVVDGYGTDQERVMPDPPGELVPVVVDQAAGVDGERAPKDSTPSGPRRLWNRLKARASGRHKRRASLDWVGTIGWSTLAQVVASRGALPTARVLEMQAPTAGLILDQALAGTLADRMLQPIARGGKRAQAAAALIGPPLLVTAISLHPEKIETLGPILKECLIQWAIVAGPKMQELAKRQEKIKEELDGWDPDVMLAEIFAPPPGMAPAEPASAA